MTTHTPPAQATSNHSSRLSLGIAFGVSEFIYSVGLLLLAAGIYLLWGAAECMAATGIVLLITAWVNALAGD